MFERRETAERHPLEALLDGLDGWGDGLLPGLCHRYHYDACRSAVLKRADLLMAARRGGSRA